MKLFKNLYWAIILLSIPLNGMEEREKPQLEQNLPKMFKRMFSLKQIAFNASSTEEKKYLEQTNLDLFLQLQPVEKTAQSILEILKIEDAQEKENKLSSIPVEIQYKVVNYFVYNFVKDAQPQTEHQLKISFINDFIKKASQKYLHELRNIVFNYTIKLTQSGQEFLAIRDRLVWLRMWLDSSTQNLAKSIVSLQEPMSQFDPKYQELIKSLDNTNWENFNIEDLPKKEIDPKLFFKYLFAIHIPSKKFFNGDYLNSCENMIYYIDQILSKCKTLNIVESLNHLLTISPDTANCLYILGNMIYAKCKFPNFTLKSILLCPKLYLMYKLKNILIHQYILSLTELIDESKIEECSEKLCQLYYMISDKRLIDTLLQSFLKGILFSKNVPSLKYNFLRSLAQSLIISLPQIDLSEESLNQLYELSVKVLTHILKDHKETANDEPLKEILNKAFLQKI